MKDSISLARQIREESIRMVYQAKASHIGSALSMVDILAVLYTSVLKYDSLNPKWGERDRFLLSKGHACVSLYSTLALRGFFPLEDLREYGKNGSKILSHISHYIDGVEISAGSLGHGLSMAAGIALAAKRKEEKFRTYVLVGDGEMDEGSIWEALLFAAHFKFDNICLIIYYNSRKSL